jgi:hypothetical protein
MAASKSKRSVHPAQPQPQSQQESQPKQPDPHMKSQLFETLKHLNRGFGVALAAFDRVSCLLDYRNRTGSCGPGPILNCCTCSPGARSRMRRSSGGYDKAGQTFNH